MTGLKIGFFGTPEFAVSLLDELEANGLVPNLIVTNPNKPKGRKLIITPPPVKVWALKRGIPVLQPEKLQPKTDPLLTKILSGFDLFIVAAYGKIVPESIINLPKYGMINVHPSILPKYRGPSPVQTTILNGDKETGVSIMLLDKEIDHGPVITQEKIELNNLSLTTDELKEKLSKVAGRLLIKILPDWINGKIKAKPQDHSQATFTKKIQKEDGFVESRDLLDENLNIEKAKTIERKVRALNPDPGVFTNIRGKNAEIRVKIIKAKIEDNKLTVERVVPEGKREMNWEDFKRGNLQSIFNS